MQSYAPFRTGLLTAAELRGLTSLRPWIAVRDTALRWAVIFMAWGAANAWTNPAVVAAAAILVGVNFYGLMIIAHDGLHRRLFNSRAFNDLFNDLFILGSIGAITRLNRINHVEHHRVTSLPEDPDRHKYVHAGKEPVVPFALFLSGLSSLAPTLRNVFVPKRDGDTAHDVRAEHYSLRDIVILIGWQAGLIGGLSWFFGWWGYPLLWVVPIYLFAYRADLTRVFCEHSVLGPDASADRDMRLISYRSNWLERQFFAPQNMNHHIPHHLWPAIPYYNLPSADALIRRNGGSDARLVWRDSYLAYLVRYARWRRAEQHASAPPAAAQS